MAENEWTDASRQEVIDAYEAAEPTVDNTMDIVKEIAVNFDKTPNGIRMILSKAGVYIKKTPATTAKADSGKTTTTRVNKAEAIGALKAAIETVGKTVDDDICDRLTGKAAVYITGLIS
jgi:hypothetical protein